MTQREITRGSSSLQADIDAYMARQPVFNRRRKILHGLLRLAVFTAAKVDVEGRDYIPDEGGAIVMMNHISFVDPALCAAVVKNRYVISMSKAENRHNLFGRISIDGWGVFPVNRGMVDRQALGIAIALVEHGQMILIAPEGTRHPEGMHDPHDGIVYIGVKSNAIIIPAAVYGAVGWDKRLKRLRRAYAGVNFGRPFRFRVPEGERLTKPLRQTMLHEAMLQLSQTIPEAYAWQRGAFSDLSHITTDYLDFL